MNEISAAVVTTFGNQHFDVYAKKMLQSFVANWPAEIPLLVQLDDDLLFEQVNACLRPQDAVAPKWGIEHAAFVERNRGKDDPQNYRFQPVRFCHKVFALARALDGILMQKAAGEVSARYLIWLDADVVTNRKVTFEDLQECLPKEGDAVSYMGRKDWPHSECGWLAFDLEHGGDGYIKEFVGKYISDEVLKHQEQHDSWIFDVIMNAMKGATNLTPNGTGIEIWPQSPMGKWSRHYKGPQAKHELIQERHLRLPQDRNVVIQTKNALPNEELRAHILENQTLITNWLHPCKPSDEEIVIVSAGPMLIPEDVRAEARAGKKIVAVKHAMQPLIQAGITPWACILLDPRPHVSDFVSNPDPKTLWFVASQCDPEVTRKLLAAGCTVWGYHANVNAGEEKLINRQPQAIISGGSATATRGMYALAHIGFSRFRLYGYDLCVSDKPDLNAKDERGQPKFLEISVGFNDASLTRKRCFWTEPQLLAQFEEMNEIVKTDRFKLEAFGDGMIPFIVKTKKLADLRNRELIAKITGGKLPTYQELLCQKPTGYLGNLLRWPLNLLRRPIRASRY